MGRLLLCDVRGPVGDLLQKLSGEEGNQWLQALNRMLRKENSWDEPVALDLDWKSAYELLGMSEEYAEFCKELGVQESPGNWIIPVLKGLTCNQVVTALRKAGSPVYSYYNDLDQEVTKNDRDPNRDGSYAIGAKAVVEADQENKNLSADQLKEQGHQGMTFLERMLLELAYFLTTGQHLDVENMTLCSGSRFRDDSVPYVHWASDDCEVCIRRSRPSRRRGFLRSRSVVSLPAKSCKARN